jgi:hypothetical protein
MRGALLFVTLLLLLPQSVRPAAAAPSAGACSRFDAVPSWSGTISVTFQRSATTPNYLESGSGSMSYHVTVVRPPLSIGLNGYDRTWVGSPEGSGRFHVQVTNANGSPLSRPVTLDGSGSVLTHPPLGKFRPEQFWIDTGKCVYAVYTSAALQGRHSRDGPRIDGVAVHVEAVPLPAAGNVVSGSKAFVLPNAGNYSGGDQFFYPCVLVDWCNRGSGTGSLAWSFTPAGAVAPQAPTTPAGATLRCPKWSARSNAGPSRLRNDLTAAFKNRADAVAYEDVSVTGSIVAGTAKIEVRLGTGKHALPSIECVDEAIANGSAGPQSQSGATQLLLGAIQQANGMTRVTLRVVDVETGQIQSSALGDAPGTNDAAVTNAAGAALGKLNVHFS